MPQFEKNLLKLKTKQNKTQTKSDPSPAQQTPMVGQALTQAY